MKADPAAQAALLDLQALDSRIAEINGALARPPQADRLREVTAQFAALSETLRSAIGTVEDTQAEIARIDDDIQVARSRRRQDEARLTASSQPKEIQGLTSELDALARRLDALEEAQLELMQREEDEAAEVARVRAERETLRVEGAELQRQQKEAEAGFATEVESLARSRADLAGRLPADLAANYDRIRSRGLGIGAARIVNKVCGACAIQLGPTDFAEFQKLTAADVAYCPSCGAILVRAVA